ncbi:MAG: hypothetical protein UU38_C0009G0005 [Candidatus Wolfebacteria bacterium GW2011_GWB1_41_12]|uniref:HD domain-containing protein n=2 Tax=Parcubacteria group TaxID=1794811 RepID=A0A0G0UHP5_9BACT|nr:MAG: hypothetical protein UU38_C0009G0005 [Candidatus Wolfebacteria bacterium GW2011_GWB1_41_12]
MMQLPKEIIEILLKLQENGFEAFAVGGCVRDLLLNRTPEDWDVTTNAKPEEIQKIFSDHFYENHFGTVTVKTDSEDPTLKEIQVTPYRIEDKYSDKRHPTDIKFVANLEDDLGRRDFTINAMAMGLDGKIIDPFDGEGDLKKGFLKAVGKPEERFGEDALRLIRGTRLATALGFKIEEKTKEAIQKNAGWLEAISKERTRDEIIKTINSEWAHEGILLLEETGLLKYILPELREGIGVTQNLHHIYTVWEHNILALKYAVEKEYSFEIRLASLFHDIGKPRTKRGEGKYSTFYGHDVVGARMVAQIMARLKFPNDIAEKIIKLVRFHMFFYNVGEVTESSVRRLLVNVGKENIYDLIKVREADRIGSGRPKAVPYKLRHLKYVIEKVSSDPISVKMLKVNGQDVMKELNVAPGPKIGLILNSLLAEVLDDPARNTEEYLIERIRELDKKSPEELKSALQKIEQAQEEDEKERMKKYYL